MTFSQFSEHLSKIESTAKRNEMTALLVELLKEASPSEIDKIVYLSLGQLAPLYAHKEFGLAEKMVIRAIARAYHKDESVVKDLYKKTGDLGITTQFFSSNHSNHSHRSVSSVFSALTAIADASGTGSQEQKLELTAELLNSLNPLGAKYAVRIILDKLRLGFSDKTVLDALSVMTSGDKSDREKLESIYNVRPDVGWLAKQVTSYKPSSRAQAEGLQVTSFRRVAPQLGTPVLPALCQRLPTTEEIVKKMGNVAVEPKWDGQRIQAHMSLNSNSKLKAQSSKLVEIKLFTRGLEDVTDMFPDLTEALSETINNQQLAISNCILDGEVVGIDPKTGRVLPFQTMITRKRKYGIAEQLKSVPIRYMVFDILSLNDESLMDEPFSKRRAVLEKLLNFQKTRNTRRTRKSEVQKIRAPEVLASRYSDNPTLRLSEFSEFSEIIQLAPQLVTDDPVSIRKFLKQQIDGGLEGIVAKRIDAPYIPGRTQFTWVKLKWEGSAKTGGLLDTIDCVVMGIYAGRGKRSSFGVGAFLVGILGYRSSVVGFRLPVNRFSVSQLKTGKPITDKHVTENREQRTDNGIFLTISKIGTGLSDEQWKELQVTSHKLQVKNKPKEYDVPKELTPDAWLEPEIVVEIQADNITKSPLHTAGFALRFPRLVRYRTDKRPEQITTLKEVKKLYQMQG